MEKVPQCAPEPPTATGPQSLDPQPLSTGTLVSPEKADARGVREQDSAEERRAGGVGGSWTEKSRRFSQGAQALTCQAVMGGHRLLGWRGSGCAGHRPHGAASGDGARDIRGSRFLLRSELTRTPKLPCKQPFPPGGYIWTAVRPPHSWATCQVQGWTEWAPSAFHQPLCGTVCSFPQSSAIWLELCPT